MTIHVQPDEGRKRQAKRCFYIRVRDEGIGRKGRQGYSRKREGKEERRDTNTVVKTRGEKVHEMRKEQKQVMGGKRNENKLRGGRWRENN